MFKTCRVCGEPFNIPPSRYNKRFTCSTKCSKKAGMLQVHHIKSWAKNPELRFNKNNCQTLCAFCHYKKTFGVEMPRDVRTWGQNLTQIGA